MKKSTLEIQLETRTKLTRRALLRNGAGLAAILAAGKAPAALMRSMLAARQSICAGGKLSAKSYVQDGLVAMWDGIENAGWGVHNPSATVWTNLMSSSYDLTKLDNSAFTADSMVRGLNNDRVAAKYTGSIPCSCIEIVGKFDASSGGRLLLNNTFLPAGIIGDIRYLALDDATYADRDVLRFAKYNWAHYGIVLAGRLTQRFALTLVYAGETSCQPSEVYLNGQQVSYVTVSNGENASGNFCLMGRDSHSYNFGLGQEICRMACRSRAPTAAEVAHNYAVDVARFNLPT